LIVGVGIDAVDIPRVERMLARFHERVVNRLFTAAEALYASRRPEPARHFAARLAAKEAAYKALAGTDLARSIGWREIEVRVSTDGAPRLELHGAAALRAAELHVNDVWVSLTHSDRAAIAVIVLERR
jgi:holo-[acyl-carrier protein] synthase